MFAYLSYVLISLKLQLQNLHEQLPTAYKLFRLAYVIPTSLSIIAP